MRKFVLIITGICAINALNAHSALLPDGSKVEVLKDFSDGLYTTMGPQDIPKTASPYIRNLLIDEKNGAIQRNGFKKLGSTSTLIDVRFQFVFNKEDGSTEFLVADSSQMLSTKDFRTFVRVSSGMNLNVNLDCAQLRNKVWCTNGSDPVFTWDGVDRINLNGNAGTPNVPRFKFIDTFQDRIFGGNTAAQGSAIYFSSLVSTDGVIIAPDDYRAWPPVNQVNIGLGEGDTITSLWQFHGQLQIGKKHSINTLFGTDPTSYKPRRIDSQIGPIANETVKVMDNLTLFLSIDGIYAFDGANIKRISDAIVPDVDAFNKDSVRIIQNLWETYADFILGRMEGSTVAANGVLTLFRHNQDAVTLNTIEEIMTPGITQTVSGLGSASSFYVRIPTFTVESNRTLYTNRISIWGNYLFGVPTGGCAQPNILMRVKNAATNKIEHSARVVTETGASKLMWVFESSVPFSGDQLASNYSISLEQGKPISGTGCDFVFADPSANNASGILLSPSATGQFISDIATITTLNAWSNLDSDNETNGGQINFYYRTSTSVVNLSTQVWKSITPGANIDAPIINNYVQWATTMVAISSDSLPLIDNVAIKHIEGSGSKTHAFAEVWKNHYWLAVSTIATGDITPIYVKAKSTARNPIAWTVFEGANLRSLIRDLSADVLYGGSSSTGVFYRMDYGTNDDGAPIATEIKTYISDLQNPFGDKDLMEFYLDVDPTPIGIMALGLAVNDGTFTDTNVSLVNPVRIVKNIPFDTNVYPRVTGNHFQLRMRQSVLDNVFALNGVGIAYVPTARQTDTTQ